MYSYIIMNKLHSQSKNSNKRFVSPPPPTPHTSQHSHQPSRTLQDSLVSGFGVGIGHNIANKLMNGVFSSVQTTPRLDINKSSNNCNDILTELDTCILRGNSDCDKLYKSLYECQYESQNKNNL
jgi:hypothetical protein